MTPNYLLEIHSVIRSAKARSKWAVILVPRGRYHDTIQAASAFFDGNNGGRTWAQPSGLTVSVAYAGLEVFVPKGEPFDLFLAGWDEPSSKEEMKSIGPWRDAAQSVVTTSDWTPH